MVLAVTLPLLQQASGINSITFYSSSVSPHSEPDALCEQLLPCHRFCFSSPCSLLRKLNLCAFGSLLWLFPKCQNPDQSDWPVITVYCLQAASNMA